MGGRHAQGIGAVIQRSQSGLADALNSTEN